VTTKQVSFGWLAPSLATQLAGKIKKRELAHFERDRLAILRAHLRGYVSDAVRDSALRKLVKAIERASHTSGERQDGGG
jgi:hypothetical protein